MFRVVIPARHASTRLAGKALADIGGRPMVQWVHERACASRASEVWVATDHADIASVVTGFGGRAVLTSPQHPSGTDRIAEVAVRLEWGPEDIIVNVQGDEPLIPPALIDQVAADLAAHADARVATLCEPVATAAELFDPNVVKVVRDGRGYAMYFSRAVIPWDRATFAAGTPVLPPGGAYHRHIGLYAYRAGFVRAYVGWPPCAPERAEMLEQLRALWHGERIHVGLACEKPGPGVDTEQDLARVERLLRDAGDC